jgi:hypothetical protein
MDSAHTTTSAMTDLPPIQLGGNLLWEDLFNGNNKYPAVSPSSQMLTLEWTVLVEIFDQSMQKRQQSLKAVFSETMGIIDNLAAKDIAEHTIFVPSGGRTAITLGTLTNVDTPWWYKMAMAGAPVVLVVSKFDQPQYQIWVTDRINERNAARESSKPLPPLNLRVAFYSGFGIGCGRHASAKLILDSQQNCYMMDDRPSKVTFDGTEILTFEQLTMMTERCLAISKEKRVPILNSAIFNHLRVFTFWAEKTTKIPFFSSNFILCKEDIALAILFNHLLQNNIDQYADTNVYQIVLKVDTNKNTGNYKNADPSSKMDPKVFKAALALTEQFADIMDCNGEPLSPAVFTKKHNFKNPLDMLKVVDAALYGLLSVIIERHPPKPKPGLKAAEGISTGKLFHSKVTKWFIT